MKLSAVIVGAGRMGASHAAALAAMDDVQIVGVADPRLETAQALAAQYGAEAHADYRELLERLRPDVAYFCSPAVDHVEQVTFAAERGVNVFVEKPLATTLAEGEAIVAAVERHGIICNVGYQWRYNPATDAARSALDGLPTALLAGWWYWTVPLVSWIKHKEWGGGQVFDQGTHLLDLMRFLAGDVTSVYAAYTRNAIAEADLPNWDANALTLRFRGGQVGSLHTSYALFPGLPQTNGLDIAARELLVRVQLGQCTVFRRGAAPEEWSAPEDWNINHAFIPILRRNDRTAVRATAQEALHSLAVTLAANYSAVCGQVIQGLEAFRANPPDPKLIMPNARPVLG